MADTRSPERGRDYRTETTVTHGAKAHSLALVLVDHLGPRIAAAVQAGILQELGAAESLETFDCAAHAARLEVPVSALRETIEHLEYLRQVGLAIEELLATKRIRDASW